MRSSLLCSLTLKSIRIRGAPTISRGMSLCTSTVLGDYIAARRKHALRTVQFPTVQELLWGAKCISETLRLVTEHCLPYLRARKMASNIVEQAVRQLGPPRDPGSSS